MLAQWCARHAIKLAMLIVGVLTTASVLSIPTLQKIVEPSFDAERLIAFRALLVGIGGSLIGATAIVFSVVMLAVQLNFARIPHGLFRRLSTDLGLLACFAATFVLGAGVGISSMIPDKTWAATAILAASWGAFLALGLFLLAYRRALDLINPGKQLNLVLRDARRAIGRWDRLATRSAPLIERRPNPDAKRDMARASFFRLQAGWETPARQAVVHALAFARRYAEQGEYDVSGAALGVLVAVNGSYIRARGRTFFSSHPLFHNPLSSEGFISDNLEQLRRLAVVAQSRGDEEQFTQVLAAMSHLANVYAAIDYGDDLGATLQHSQLAGGYLTRAVEGAARVFGPDVLMDGLRHMGAVAQLLVRGEQSSAAASIGQSMSMTALVGLTKPGFGPVTSTAVEQLAKLSFALLTSKERDVEHACEDVRSSISFVATATLETADGGLEARHRTNMAPYYSLAAVETFGNWVTRLVNSLNALPEESEEADTVLDHLEQWSDGIYDGEKKLLLAGVAKRSSSLTFDLIHWICHVTTLLVAASRAPAASGHTVDKLVENATRLISVLDWLPSDKESVVFLAAFDIEDRLFEVAMDAQARGAANVAIAARDTLLNWAFKTSVEETGRRPFERSVTGLAVAAASQVDTTWTEWLEAEVKERLAKGVLTSEQRDRAAREIRRQSANQGRAFSLSPIDQTLRSIDRERYARIVATMADLLSPAAVPTPSSPPTEQAAARPPRKPRSRKKPES